MHKSQEAGKGTKKMYGGGGKTSPSHPTPLCPYLHPDDLWFQNHKMATAGNMERCFVRKIRQYVAGSHMTFGLPSRDFWLQARLTIYSPQSHSTSKTKTADARKMESFFALKIRLHVLVFEKYDANLLLYCYLRLAE